MKLAVQPGGDDQDDALQGFSFDEGHQRISDRQMNIVNNDLVPLPSPVYLQSEAAEALHSAVKHRVGLSQEKFKNLIMNERKFLSPRNNIRTTNTKNMSSINVLDVQLNNKANLNNSSMMNSSMMAGRNISN